MGAELEAEAAADEKEAEEKLHGHMEDKPIKELDMCDKSEHEPKGGAAIKGKWPGGKKEPAPKKEKEGKGKGKGKKKAGKC